MTCAKQTTIAIIKNGNRFWVGSNRCEKPQKRCPRAGMKTGEGYALCREVCGQASHAEVDACKKAGPGANGGTLYLIWHHYCCESCKATMKAYGIKKVVICDDRPVAHDYQLGLFGQAGNNRSTEH